MTRSKLPSFRLTLSLFLLLSLDCSLKIPYAGNDLKKYTPLQKSYSVNLCLSIENRTDGAKGEGENYELPQKCEFFKSQ